ncbi:MAG TPA: cytochrome C oxidase subunit IV family protein [Opitutaceae bacterium]|nr:cytochrome C oxidase subunit IV family protein [Opitutaceae bacterium]
MTSIAHAPAGDHGHHQDNKFEIYVQIALLLAVITGVEIVMVYLPFLKWLLVSGLVVLSIVKFMFVIFYFMHLRWDKPFCTILFFIGLVLAIGTVWALIRLFSVEDGRPLTAAPQAAIVSPSSVVAAAS